MQEDRRFLFIYNNAACPSDPCSHMHTHADACALFRGRFSPQAMENKHQVQSSKNQAHPFFLGKQWPQAISDLIMYMESCESTPCSKTGGVGTISRSHLWVKENNHNDLDISSKQFLQRTQEICFAVYQDLQAAQEQIHLLLCFLTVKCRLSFPALPRVIAVTSLSVCLS